MTDALTGDISGTVLRRADSAYIPDDPANRDRAEYSAWVDDGGVPDPPDPPPEPEPQPLTLQAHPEGPMDATTVSSVESYVAAELAPIVERLAAVEQWLSMRPGAVAEGENG